MLMVILFMWYYMLLIGNNKEITNNIKSQLSYMFDIKDLVATNFILGMEIKEII
jgi:hypothetical protein